MAVFFLVQNLLSLWTTAGVTRRNILLRITKVGEEPLFVTLKLEGRIVSDWVGVLEQECLESLREKGKVILDFSAVTFIDSRGIAMLRRIATGNLEIVNASLLVDDLLQAGGDE